MAYGRIYANKGAMTPGVTRETVDWSVYGYRREQSWKEPSNHVRPGRLGPTVLPSSSVLGAPVMVLRGWADTGMVSQALEVPAGPN